MTLRPIFGKSLKLSLKTKIYIYNPSGCMAYSFGAPPKNQTQKKYKYSNSKSSDSLLMLILISQIAPLTLISKFLKSLMQPNYTTLNSSIAFKITLTPY